MPPDLPIAVYRSLLSAAALADRLLPAYDLPTGATCAFWSQSINDTYLVRAGDQRWMLRIAPAGRRSLAQHDAELDLLRYLHRKGLTVSTPVPRRDGSFLTTLAAPEGQRLATLFTVVPGAPFTPTEANSERYGQAVALLHEATNDYALDPVVWVFETRELIDQPLALLQPWFAHRPRDFAVLTAVAERGGAAMASLPRTLLDYGLCHGDVNDNNIHLIGDEAWGMLDFEYVGKGWRIFDIATFFSNQLVQRGSSTETQGLLDAFLRGYEAVRPLSEAERAALPAFVGLRQLWLCGIGVTNQPGVGLGLFEEWLFERCLPLFRQIAGVGG
jgi:Ser/Thr protein kinase RdoA (MazF antagonist)